MQKKKRSFLERLTGSISLDEDDVLEAPESEVPQTSEEDWMDQEAEEGQLTVDVYQTPEEIVIKSMVAGVRPEDLNISITRDMVTIKGQRKEESGIMEGDYFFKELYWGNFSRTILLPEEIDPDGAEAVEKHGMLTIRLPKIDKEKVQKVKVKIG